MPFTHNANDIDKVVFLGETGVGKTTALNSISDTPITNTQLKSIDAQAQRTSENIDSAHFDHGYWDLEASKKTYVIAMPSQDGFHHIWDLVLPSSSAVVIWARGDKEDGVENCRVWLERLQSYGLIERMCLAVTRTMANNETKLDEFRSLVAEFHPYVPVITADPREKESVIQAVTVGLSIMYLDN